MDLVRKGNTRAEVAKAIAPRTFGYWMARGTANLRRRRLRTRERHGSLHRVTLDDALAEGLFQRQCERRGVPWSPEIQRVWRDEKMASRRRGRRAAGCS